MKRILACFFFLLGILCGDVIAENPRGIDPREIELTDGSSISGKIVSFSNGVYTLKSDSLGTIKINESKIRAIRLKSCNTTQDTSAEKHDNSLKRSMAAETQVLRETMMQDNDIINIIFSLQSDPDFQKVLQDPAIIEAITSGDMDTLMSNPNFIKLTGNRKVQEIKRKLLD